MNLIVIYCRRNKAKEASKNSTLDAKKPIFGEDGGFIKVITIIFFLFKFDHFV